MWVLGLVIMIDQADQNIVRGVATPIQHAFHLTDLQVGVLLSCFIVVNGFVSVPAGYLADRWHRTRTVGHTVVIWSAITSLTAAAWSYPALIAIRSALGFGQAVTEPATASLLADHYPVTERGRAFSVQQCLLFVGFGMGLGIGGIVGATIGWRAAFLVVSLMLVVVRVSRLETALVARDPDEEVVAAPEPAKRRLVGRIAFGIPVALLVTAVGVGGAQVVPVAAGTQRFDPRTVTPQRYDVSDMLSPLVGLKGQLKETPAQELFTIRITDDGGQPLDRVRTAALDNYNGSLWTADDSFLLAGHTLPPDPNLEHPRRVTAHVQVGNLTGPYLPVLGWPVKIDATGLGFSASSGVLVGPGADLQGISYDVVGEVPVRDADLPSAVPNLSGSAGKDTQLPPGLPPELEQEATRLTAQASAPFAKLVAIEKYLRTLPYSLQARPGHSYDALRRLFGANAQDRIGYAEQFASAFAVLARAQGFPTRVAVGYLLRSEAKQGDTYRVTTADAHAWAEVNLARYGWVSFDPTDTTHRATATPDKKTETTTPDKPGDPQLPEAQPAKVDPTLSSGPGTGAKVLAGSLIGAGVLVVVILLTLLGIVIEKVRRRYRRRLGSGNDRIVGAWREVTDRLVERGIPVPRSLTAVEAAAHAEEQLGEPARSVAVLAPIVTAAVFYPGEPLEDNVRDAWDLSTQFRRDLRRSRGMLRALRALFDPRPLVYAWSDRRRLSGALKELQEG